MLNAFNIDFSNVQKAWRDPSAPAKVQAAFKNLLSFVKQFQTTSRTRRASRA